MLSLLHMSGLLAYALAAYMFSTLHMLTTGCMFSTGLRPARSRDLVKRPSVTRP
jgi:hypothetical protein